MSLKKERNFNHRGKKRIFKLQHKNLTEMEIKEYKSDKNIKKLFYIRTIKKNGKRDLYFSKKTKEERN